MPGLPPSWLITTIPLLLFSKFELKLAAAIALSRSSAMIRSLSNMAGGLTAVKSAAMFWGGFSGSGGGRGSFGLHFSSLCECESFLESCWAFFDRFHFILRFWNHIFTCRQKKSLILNYLNKINVFLRVLQSGGVIISK